MLIENIEDAITLTDNRQAKWQLSKFLKDMMKLLVGSGKCSRKEFGEYLLTVLLSEASRIALLMSDGNAEAHACIFNKFLQLQYRSQNVNVKKSLMAISH